MKHAPDLLDDIWKQRRHAYLKFFKPKLRIWLNKYDLQTLVMETNLLPRDSDITAVINGTGSTQLFGENVLVAPDIKEGEPIVEVIDD